MVSAILLHYVIDDPLPTRGTFGDPGSNSDAVFAFFSFFPTCLVLSTCSTAFLLGMYGCFLKKKKKKKDLQNHSCTGSQNKRPGLQQYSSIISSYIVDIPHEYKF